MPNKMRFESLFPLWGTAWGIMWKTSISPLFTTLVYPWGATKLDAIGLRYRSVYCGIFMLHKKIAAGITAMPNIMRHPNGV